MFWKLISLLSLLCVIALAIVTYHERIAPVRDDSIALVAQLCVKLDSMSVQLDMQRDEISLLQYYLTTIELKFDMSREKGRYLVIGRHASKFWVRDGDMVIYEGKCGVGRGASRLGRRIYDFETPAGHFKVVRKLQNPWWFRPDWFWREKGLDVPRNFISYPNGATFNQAVAFYNSLSKEDKLHVRAVPGYLGKYVLQIADGIYIHYSSQVGGAVSHGCIRVSEHDAEALYKLLDIESPVYVF